MNPTVRQLLFGLIFFVAGVAIGWIFGTVSTYKETAALVADQQFTRSAADLETSLSLLQSLHGSEYEKVSRKLEEMVDRDLVALAHYPDPVLPSEDKVIGTIVKAKQYRERYPVTGRSAEVSTAIDKVFEKARTKDAHPDGLPIRE